MKNGLEIDSNANKWHWFNDNSHRDDGPAVEFADGGVSYYRHGKLHRKDGPALITSAGDRAWYFNNIEIKVKSQKEFESYIKLIAFI
jgi:hypothetical protein